MRAQMRCALLPQIEGLGRSIIVEVMPGVKSRTKSEESKKVICAEAWKRHLREKMLFYMVAGYEVRHGQGLDQWF